MIEPSQPFTSAPQPSSAADPVQRIRQQWAWVIAAVVAAAQGNHQATQELAPYLDDLGQQEHWRNLVAVLRRIMAGERDPEALLPSLDDADTLIAVDVLKALDVDVDDDEEQGITLD
jgi:hypothetical protein